MFDTFTPQPSISGGRLATLVDVTMRDGGYEVDFNWPLETFALAPAAMHAAGVEIVEVGYIGGLSSEHDVAHAGVGADIGPEHLARARRDGLVLAAMLHPSAVTTRLDLGAYADAGLTMVRVIYSPGWLDGIARLAAHARTLGMIVAVNLTQVSRCSRAVLTEHAHEIGRRVRPDLVYLADSCGALYPDQVGDLVTGVSAVVDAEIGFHGHDFLNLAHANALAAVAAGATYLDVSLLGLGRGGGNLVAEPLLLRHRRANLDLTATELLLTWRRRLTVMTGRRAGTLLATVCAALNLSSVDQQALREFAALEQIDPERAAVWLLHQSEQIATLRVPDLRTQWHRGQQAVVGDVRYEAASVEVSCGQSAVRPCESGDAGDD